jgi:hypothetical protein
VEQIAARQRAASDWVKRGYISPNEVDDVRAIGQAMNLFVWDAGKADQRKCDKVCHARVRSSMSTVSFTSPSPHFRDEKSYIGGTAPLPNSTAPLSSVPSACLSVGTKTIAPGLISLCSEGTSPTIGIFAGMVIFFSPPL